MKQGEETFLSRQKVKVLDNVSDGHRTPVYVQADTLHKSTDGPLPVLPKRRNFRMTLEVMTRLGD